MSVMTTPNPMQFLDPNNPLLSGGNARLDVGSISPPAGEKMGVVTVRTSSTTLTILMNATNLREWAGILNGLADDMGGGKLQAASPLDVMALKKL